MVWVFLFSFFSTIWQMVAHLLLFRNQEGEGVLPCALIDWGTNKGSASWHLNTFWEKCFILLYFIKQVRENICFFNLYLYLYLNLCGMQNNEQGAPVSCHLLPLAPSCDTSVQLHSTCGSGWEVWLPAEQRTWPHSNLVYIFQPKSWKEL